MNKNNKKDQYSIRKIFENEYEKFRKKRLLPLHVKNAVQAILDCRTPVYGGRMYGCPDEHYSLILFNSCKKRNCPTCQGAEIEYWNQVQKKRLLKTGHYHLVFKQPDLLNGEFLSNYSEYARLLFDSVRDTLKEVLPKGLKPGLIQLLHTHGQNNQLHPHLHCAITDGGMNEEGKYEKYGEKCLSVDNLLSIYQKQYTRKLRKRVKDGRIKHELGGVELSRMITEKGMSLFVSSLYESGDPLISYFARSSRGGAIRDNQLSYADSEIVRYRQKSGKETEMKTETFIQRFLYHIPPDRFNTVRYCGIYSTGSVEVYQQMRWQLGQESYSKPDRKEVFEKEDNDKSCPVCNKGLVLQESFLRNSIPFLLLSKLKFNSESIISQYWNVRDKRRGLKFLWPATLPRTSILMANDYK